MSETKKQTYMRGAAILAATAVVVKIISAIFKIPLFNLIGDEGTGHFQVTYSIYMLLLTISTAGIPVALSRQISAAAATGRHQLVKRYFSVALPVFMVVGAIFAVLMFVFADQLARFMNDSQAAAGIRVLAPAVFFACAVSPFEGYGQGHQNMTLTAVKQLLEVTGKLVFGLSIAWYLTSHGASLATAAAGAITGITIGLGISLPVMVVLKKKMDSRNYGRLRPVTREEPVGRLKILYNIFKVAIPVTLGAALINILTIIDTKFVLLRLQTAVGYTQTVAVSLYGAYSKGLTLLVLPTSFITPITISIIPAIAGALAADRIREAKVIMQSSMKLTNLIAMPAAAGMCILSYPIFRVLYWNSDPVGPTLLAIFGVASFFVCMQLMTTAILQASGHEKVPVFTFPFGGILQIGLDWVLVGNPHIGIIGSPIGTLTCYVVITVLNFIFIAAKVKNRPRFLPAFAKPALCTAAMGVAAWATYGLLYKLLAGHLGSGRLALAVYLFGAIAVSVVVYAVLIIATKTITREDMKLVPRGEKLANFLKIK